MPVCLSCSNASSSQLSSRPVNTSMNSVAREWRCSEDSTFSSPKFFGFIETEARHHVPARAATADVVQRGQLTGEVERLGVGRGARADEAQVRRNRGQRG